MSPTTPFSTLARALARGTRPGDLLPELHRELLAATGGRRSVVLEAAGPSGDYVATSGRGFVALDALRVRAGAAGALRSLAAAGGRMVNLSVVPALAAQFDADRALIVPVPLARRETIVIVAGADLPDPDAIEVAARAAVEFGIVLEWSGLAREGSFHRRMRELSLVFTRGVRSTASMGPALEIVAHEANALFGTRRTSVWLHERRARELVLSASSDPAAAIGERLATDAPAPPARGLLIDRPELVSTGEGRVLVAPLRGWRRALGALVIEGAAAVDDEHLIELGHELGRQLAAGIENVQLLDEVLRQRRLLEDTFNSLTDLVLVTDSALRIVQVNDACTASLSRPRGDLIGRGLHDVVGTAVAAWAAEDADRRASGDRSLRARTFEDPALPGIFAMTAAPLVTQEEDTAGLVLVARDITAQNRLEADREALGQRLAQSEKLAALGQFVAGIAHEMNNPLQGILGHLELLIGHSDQARPVRRDLRRVYREAERASRTVHNLLVFTGSRRMKRRRLRVERIVARALAGRRAALDRAGIDVVRRFPGDLPTVTGDPLLLQQAFLNIVINAEHAVEAAPGAGRIEIAGAREHGHVRVTIRDNGPGLGEDLLPRIFEPFFTTKDVGKGTGLGLAITYGIVQEHGGQIQAANAPGGGAIFTLTLPVSADVR